MMCALAAQPDPAVLNVGTGGSVVVQAGGSLVVGGDGSNVEPKADWTGWNPETGPTNGRKLTVLVDNVKRVYELFKQADPSVVATPDFPSGIVTALQPQPLVSLTLLTEPART